MPRLSVFLLLVFSFFLSSSNTGSTKTPLETLRGEALFHQRMRQAPTSEEAWELAFSMVWSMLNDDVCAKAFRTETGRDGVKFALGSGYVLVVQEDWKHIAYAGYTTCDPPWIAIDHDLAMDFGPTTAAKTIIHELVHAATCDEWWGHYDKMEDTEIIAQAVQDLCES